MAQVLFLYFFCICELFPGNIDGNFFGDNIVHVHLSDYNESKDCIAPCKEGMFDFENLFTHLHKSGYKGKYIIELYSDGYEKTKEITDGAKYLDAMLNKIRQG